MKKQILLLAFFLSSFFAFSQKTIENSFKIENTTNSTLSQQFIERALLKADLEPYRDKDKNVTLVFSNGFEVELFSAASLVSKGLLPETTNYTVKNIAKNASVFTMLDTGHIMVAAPAAQNVKYKSTKK